MAFGRSQLGLPAVGAGVGGRLEGRGEMLNLKVGDLVIEQTVGSIPPVLTVVHVTKTRATLSDGRIVLLTTGREYGSQKYNVPLFALATPEDVAHWEELQTRHGLLRMIRGTATVGLTTDQLRQIVALMESFTKDR